VTPGTRERQTKASLHADAHGSSSLVSVPGSHPASCFFLVAALPFLLARRVLLVWRHFGRVSQRSVPEIGRHCDVLLRSRVGHPEHLRHATARPVQELLQRLRCVRQRACFIRLQSDSNQRDSDAQMCAVAFSFSAGVLIAALVVSRHRHSCAAHVSAGYCSTGSTGSSSSSACQRASSGAQCYSSSWIVPNPTTCAAPTPAEDPCKQYSSSCEQCAGALSSYNCSQSHD
jgi:hypothetical protein